MKRSILPILTAMLVSAAALHAQTVGLIKHAAGSQDNGYVLFAPMGNTTTYLIDKCGKLVHKWTASVSPGTSVYMLPDGNLLRPGIVSANNHFSTAGGAGGFIQKFDWSGKLLWNYRICDSMQCQHHDVEPLPNGNVLAIVWERITPAAAISMGRDPSRIPSTKELWGEKIVELKQTGPTTADIVWEWHAWDHLVQDFDSTKPNYGTVSDHPELIDLNHVADPTATQASWLHMNCVKYNAELDQIMVSPRNWSEVWIIDHSTTTVEAAAHKGGKHGKGGDLLYRWGNPATYKSGGNQDQKLYLSHNPNWIPKGYPGAGKIIIFNNGNGRPDGAYSSGDIFSTPVDANGNYNTSTVPYLPNALDASITTPQKTDFYGAILGSAQMLPNGNVLMCSGPQGEFVEIDTNKNKVWDYISPVKGTGPVSQGTPGGFQVFRCTWYPADYAGFNGQTLTAGDPIELNPASYTCALNNSGINSAINSDNFSINNPFRDLITIRADLNAKSLTMILVDASGRRVQTWNNEQLTPGNALYLQPSENLKPGIYYLQTVGADICYTARLVKE